MNTQNGHEGPPPPLCGLHSTEMTKKDRVFFVQQCVGPCVSVVCSVTGTVAATGTRGGEYTRLSLHSQVHRNAGSAGVPPIELAID